MTSRQMTPHPGDKRFRSTRGQGRVSDAPTGLRQQVGTQRNAGSGGSGGGMGSVNRVNAGFEFEVSAIVEALNAMYKAANILDPKSKEGKKVVQITAEEVKNGIGDRLYEEALKRQESVAHVFDWQSVIDRTPDAGRSNTLNKGKRKEGNLKRTKTARARKMDKHRAGPRQYTDTAVKFVPKIKPKVPLFFLRNVGKSGNIRSVVGFMEATETDYDEEVYYIEMYRPQGLGKHWFIDQAQQLESVPTIKKQSSRPSKRRSGGGSGASGGGESGKRIIQIFGSRGSFRLVNFSTYQRKNKFHSAFARFFRTFATTKANQSTANTLVRIQKSIEKVYIKEIDRVAARQSQAAAALTVGSVIKTTARGGMRVQPLKLTLYGKAIKKLPPLDSSGIAKLVAEIEKTITKDSPPSYNLAGRQRNEPVQKLKHLGPVVRDARESGGSWSWSR